MNKKELLLEGKQKNIFSTEDKELIILSFKDDLVAFHGLKKALIKQKGVIINAISAYLLQILAASGIKTHFVKKLNEREQLCHKLKMFLFKITIRNIAAGMMTSKLEVVEGTILNKPVYEISIPKDDNKILINEDHLLTLNLCSEEQWQTIYQISQKINKILCDLFMEIDIKLVDLKLEFGINQFNEIILGDEISPDNARLWDCKTGMKFDKDRFRNDLGGIYEAYQEVLNRLTKRGIVNG